jgi:hypothetical protein
MHLAKLVKALVSFRSAMLAISVGWFILAVVALVKGELGFATIGFLLSAGFAHSYFREHKRLGG